MPRENLPERRETQQAQPERFLDKPLAGFRSLWPTLFGEDFFNLSEDLTSRGARIYEEDNKLIVEAPLPGLNANEIEVNLHKGTLWIRGESKEEESDKKKKFYRSSRRSYSFSFALPKQIDEKQEPQATYNDGILKVSLNLSKEAQPKKIPVKAGNNKK